MIFSNFGIDYVLYLLCFGAILVSVYAQIKVSGTFRKYSSVYTRDGRSAAEVARMILDKNGLYGVRIERVRGNLTDHYNPRASVLRLSDGVYGSSSAAAVGVAAHEAGHAVQHAKGYLPVIIRSKLVPITGFASRFSWLVIMAGILLMMLDGVLGYYTVLFGIGLFAVVALFQLVTLPVEFNASRRAMEALEGSGRYGREELSASRKVLSAAALTYVAALLVSLLQLLRLVVRFTGNRRR